jgi:uncharacterized protein
MQCRSDCGACCIAPSISSAIPGMPEGKPAGVRCIQLDSEDLCLLFGMSNRPAVCLGFQAMSDVCGASRSDALWLIADLERQTS